MLYFSESSHHLKHFYKLPYSSLNTRAKNFADIRKVPVQIIIGGLNFRGLGATAKFIMKDVKNISYVL